MSIISDLILVGVSEVSNFDFPAAKTSAKQQKNIRKFNMKFNLKRFTFFIVIVAAVAFAAFKLPKTSLEFAENQGSKFNSNFKNYNRILDIFADGSTKVASFKIAIADTEKKKQYGLMNLNEMPQDHGMVFTFYPSQMVNMWMKNTNIPLDMIFIDADNEIAAIKSNTVPHSLELISSGREVTMALEINAGLSEKFGLEIGQKVRILNNSK
jgi:uncharacterized membrane protein (UPF0127 family)